MKIGADVYIDYLKEFNKLTSCDFAQVLAFYELNQVNELPLAVTARLQYLDVITQRIQHLIDTHEKVMSLYIDNLFKQSFLHLQNLQFSITVFDVLESISIIDAHLSKTQKEFNCIAFANRHAMAMLTEKIQSDLTEYAGINRLTGIPGLTNKQREICRGLYTMESERLVLEWYLANPDGKPSELLEVYQSWLDDNRHTSIELFEND